MQHSVDALAQHCQSVSQVEDISLQDMFMCLLPIVLTGCAQLALPPRLLVMLLRC